MHLKNPDLTETYPVIILSEGKVNRIFIGKSCGKFGITLDIPSIITNLIMFFFFDQWLYIRKDEYCKKNLI